MAVVSRLIRANADRYCPPDGTPGGRPSMERGYSDIQGMQCFGRTPVRNSLERTRLGRSLRSCEVTRAATANDEELIAKAVYLLKVLVRPFGDVRIPESYVSSYIRSFECNLPAE